MTFMPMNPEPIGFVKHTKKAMCYKAVKDKNSNLTIFEHGDYVSEENAMAVCEEQNVDVSDHFINLNFNIDKAVLIMLKVVKAENLVLSLADIRSSIDCVFPQLLGQAEIAFRVRTAKNKTREVRLIVDKSEIDYEDR